MNIINIEIRIVFIYDVSCESKCSEFHFIRYMLFSVEAKYIMIPDYIPSHL